MPDQISSHPRIAQWLDHIHALAVDIGPRGPTRPEERKGALYAQAQLEIAGFLVIPALREGNLEPVLHSYRQERAIDLVAMGAYGHSRLRRLLLGSTTSQMLHKSRTPLLLLR